MSGWDRWVDGMNGWHGWMGGIDGWMGWLDGWDWMDWWMGWIDGMGGWIHGMDVLMQWMGWWVGWMDGMDGWMDGLTDGMDRTSCSPSKRANWLHAKKEDQFEITNGPLRADHLFILRDAINL